MTNLLEVFSIQIFSNKSKDKSIKGRELYGTVVVNDLCGTSVYFRADGVISDNLILPDGTLLLTGPTHCSVSYEWLIRLKLYLKDGDTFLELCNGYWEVVSRRVDKLKNKLMSVAVRGRDGYALVNFLLCLDAVQATVVVSLVDSAGVAFYGDIHASNDRYKPRNHHEKKYFKSTLFYASRGKPCPMEDGKIPLLRRKIAVPLFGNLILKAHMSEAVSDRLLVDGIISLKAKTSGYDTEICGGIKVEVTWAKHLIPPHPGECNLLCPNLLFSPSEECNS